MSTQVGNYILEEPIGEGGMGKVWLARHQSLKRRAAVKVLSSALAGNEQIRARFRQEASILEALKHPNVVQLYDFIESEAGGFLVLEYAEGQPLDDYIRQVTGPIPEERALPIFRQVLEAVQYAHSQGIIHRDLKPGNIIYDPESGQAKILDFGIAKILKEEAHNKFSTTQQGMRLGTVFYMAPEQVRSQPVDYRTDIYALGIILFQMLTGRLPFEDGSSEFDIQEHIVRHPLPPMRDFYPMVSDRMQAMVDKATAKRPEERYQSIGAWLEALDQPQTGEEAAEKEPAKIASPGPSAQAQTTQNAQAQAEKKTNSGATAEKEPPKSSSMPRKRSGRGWQVLLGLLVLGAVGAGFFLWKPDFSEKPTKQDVRQELKAFHQQINQKNKQGAVKCFAQAEPVYFLGNDAAKPQVLGEAFQALFENDIRLLMVDSSLSISRQQEGGFQARFLQKIYHQGDPCACRKMEVQRLVNLNKALKINRYKKVGKAKTTYKKEPLKPQEEDRLVEAIEGHIDRRPGFHRMDQRADKGTFQVDWPNTYWDHCGNLHTRYTTSIHFKKRVGRSMFSRGRIKHIKKKAGRFEVIFTPDFQVLKTCNR